MTQSDIERQVSRATGESLCTIQDRGFREVGPLLDECEPQTVDWDALEEERGAFVGQYSRSVVPA